MIANTTPTLVEQLEAAGVKVDVDSMDPKVAKALPFTPHDMTSNQLLVNQQLQNPENEELVKQTIKENPNASWLDIHTILTTRFAKRVLPLLQGRVLAQTSPAEAYNMQAIVDHARAYAASFNKEGIDHPYFNGKLYPLPSLFADPSAEVRAHAEQDLWPDVEDPATEHPMAYRMIHIRDTYAKLKKETGKEQPMVKSASFISAREAMAMVEFQAEHATISDLVLDDLSRLTKLLPFHKGTWQVPVSKQLEEEGNFKYEGLDAPSPPASKDRMAELSKADPLGKKMQADFTMASTDIDYLADGVLDKCNEEDEVTRLRLNDALVLFQGGEQESKATIERLQKEYA
ncbi:hypothetical protein P7C73_g4668, partial [Tremellales sp. Uapishka_1]